MAWAPCPTLKGLFYLQAWNSKFSLRAAWVVADADSPNRIGYSVVPSVVSEKFNDICYEKPGWDCNLVIKCLPSMLEALGSADPRLY